MAMAEGYARVFEKAQRIDCYTAAAYALQTKLNSTQRTLPTIPAEEMSVIDSTRPSPIEIEWVECSASSQILKGQLRNRN